ncbi:MAG: hypothetical protein ACK5MK_13190 [Dysgonomonas sp.]
MNKLLNKILIVSLATLIFFIGAGFTVINYCCNSCVHKADTEETTMTCCGGEVADDQSETSDCHSGEVAEPSHHQAQAQAPCTEAHGETYCVSERVFVDLDSYQFRPQVSAPFTWIQNLFGSEMKILVDNLFPIDNLFDQYKTVASIPPRTYLSLIRVLII